ncbi:hypothetical protein CO045_00290 [Candidatus Peregrinibacteria bacterium CG_4_9_14_0_2_um_filter_41_14]|nr:MAG: hypothetical protein CO045_00290 [Candidatus Peregrinibacteria bacterium CG_4_9_14_0_2_um_filter_41_14]
MSTLLQVTNLTKSYGAHTLFEDATLNITTNQKVGVIGRNGAGKSTLFRIITGEESADFGEIIIHKNARIGYLTQHNPFEVTETVMAFLTRSSNEEEWKCAKIAAQFQLTGDLLNQEIGALAGGYQMRVKLVDLLLKEPNLLLLDEPTNYLDLSTQLLFEAFLQSYKGGFLLISHDREFMKKTCTSTAEIEHGKITLFPKPLEEYFAYKEMQMGVTLKSNQKVEQKREHLQKFVDRFGSKASKAASAQSKLKQIERLNTIEVKHTPITSRIVIPDISQQRGIALKVNDLSIGYPEKVIATKIDLEIERGEHIAIVGDNGQGKTTLLKTIAGELKAITGTYKWGHEIKIGYYAQHVPALLPSETTVIAYLEQCAPINATHQDILAMAGNFLFKDEATKDKIAVLSGGERARLCLAGLLLQKNHILILDEPTNHLDFETTEALASALHNANCTVIFVSHNRTFVELLANGIVQVKVGTVSRYYHNYEEYVYHIKSELIKDINPSKEQASPDTSAEKAKPNQKEIRKQVRTIENTIKKLEAERHELLQWFENNATKYSEEKNRRLKEIHDHLEAQEGEWLRLQID